MDLGGLNEQQRQAVTHSVGPLLVVAGAGTGKTEVIAYRIAYLIESKLAKPQEILALTFTEKAAGEMIDRLDTLLGWSAHQVSVMTFHAFGAQLLVKYGHHHGLSNKAELITKNIKMLLLRQHLSEVNLSYYGAQSDLLDFLDGCISYIEGLQNNDISVLEFSKYVNSLKASPVAHKMDIEEAEDRLKLYELYTTLKRRYGLIDHHDQIALPLELLSKRPNIAKRLAGQYRFVLVDEYQDTNASQDELLRAFLPKDGNIFAVGDDDQAIYGFRGAKVENILNFAEHFAAKKPVVLTANYRSTQKILDHAYKMIKHNDPDRLEAKLGLNKQLKSQVAGQEPRIETFLSFQDEAAGVADMIEVQIKKLDPENIGVLATTHAALQSLARVLRRRGVPHRLISTVKIFEQKELLHLWYLLRWLAMNADDEAVTQLLMGPFFNWSSGKVRVLTEFAKKELITLEQALEQIASGNAEAGEVVEKLKLWRQWANTINVSELAYRLVTETGLSETWIDQAGNSPRMVQVFEDLQLLLRQMQEFEGIAGDKTLAGYLNLFPQPPDLEASEVYGEEGGVALLTVHASKGLEFDTVYLINNTREAWIDKAIPLQADIPAELKRSQLELGPEHERRRLMYVAMTRAKNQLVLTASQMSQSGRVRRLNPFMLEAFEPDQLKPSRPIQLTNKLEQAIDNFGRFAPSQAEWRSNRLPFESADGWLELNITDLDKYINCPYEFYLEKVLKISSPMGPAIQFGSLLHDLFNDYYQAEMLGEKLSLPELSRRLEERWSDRGYRTTAEAESAKKRAESTLKAFFTREENRSERIKNSEEPINLKIPEARLKLKGRIDAIFETASGLEVRDFKTGRLRDKDRLDDKAKNNFQLRTYALAAQEMTGKIPEKVVLDYVVTGVEGEAKLTPKILENHRHKLAQIADGIRARNFEPSKNMYHKCIAHKYWGSEDTDE